MQAENPHSHEFVSVYFEALMAAELNRTVDGLCLHRQISDIRNSVMETDAVCETLVNLNHLTPLSAQTSFTEPWWWRRIQCLKRRFDLNNLAWLSAREGFAEVGCSTWNPKFRDQVFGSLLPKKCLKRLKWIAAECVSYQFSIEWLPSPCKYFSLITGMQSWEWNFGE